MWYLSLRENVPSPTGSKCPDSLLDEKKKRGQKDATVALGEKGQPPSFLGQGVDY